MGREQIHPRERLPGHLLADPPTAILSETLLDQALTARAGVFSLAEQFSPNTATWAISEWERLTGLTGTGTLPIQVRRSAAIAKMCGASGTTTPAMLKRLAEAMTGCQVEVLEHPEDYSFSIRFVGEQAGFVTVDSGVLTAAIEEVKPAHLKFYIEPITWDDLEEMGLTWDQVEAQFPSWYALENTYYRHALQAGAPL